MNDEPDLSLITTDQLWDEIKSRFDSAVLLIDNSVSSTHSESRTYWAGSLNACIGLCTRYAKRLIEESYSEDDE